MKKIKKINDFSLKMVYVSMLFLLFSSGVFRYIAIGLISVTIIAFIVSDSCMNAADNDIKEILKRKGR